MALKIIKLAVASETKFTTSPTISRFFHETSDVIPGASTYKIYVGDLLDDTGNTAESLPSLHLNNSYFNVFINGVLQMEDNFAYTAGEDEVGFLMIYVPEGSDIPVNTPIILEVINFNPIVKTTFAT
jgi:hypothetical protein